MKKITLGNNPFHRSEIKPTVYISQGLGPYKNTKKAPLIYLAGLFLCCLITIPVIA